MALGMRMGMGIRMGMGMGMGIGIGTGIGIGIGTGTGMSRAHDPPAPGAPNAQDHPAHLTPGQGEALPSSSFPPDLIKL